MGRVRWALPAARRPHLTPTLSAPKGGEGDFQLTNDRLQYALDVFHYIPIPEPDHPIAPLRKFPAPCLVLFERIRVLPAIELNR